MTDNTASREAFKSHPEAILDKFGHASGRDLYLVSEAWFCQGWQARDAEIAKLKEAAEHLRCALVIIRETTPILMQRRECEKALAIYAEAVK